MRNSRPIIKQKKKKRLKQIDSVRLGGEAYAIIKATSVMVGIEEFRILHLVADLSYPNTLHLQAFLRFL